jgi:uncharacterized protein (TIGR00290 family)
MNVISSWSGGKDSCLALYKVQQQGHSIKTLMNFVSAEHKRCSFHGIPFELIKMQSEALGIPLVAKEIPDEGKKYEENFKSCVNDLKKKYDIKGIIFGDIYLDEHKKWVSRVCNDLKVKVFEPLWQLPVDDIIKEFIDLGFKSIIVSAKSDLFDESFIGRVIDHKLIEELKKKNICICGENGEFHSYVFDGPIFKKKINIKKTDKILKNGLWKHWHLDIKEFEFEDK